MKCSIWGNRLVRNRCTGEIDDREHILPFTCGLTFFACVYEKTNDQEGMFLVNCTRKGDARKLAMSNSKATFMYEKFTAADTYCVMI